MAASFVLALCLCLTSLALSQTPQESPGSSIFLTPTFTSLVPSYPNVVLSIASTGPNLPFHYTVPSGFREVIFTCIAVGRPSPPSVRWFKDTASNANAAIFSTFSSNSRIVSSFTVAELYFESGFSASDAGRYYCAVQEILYHSISLSVAFRNSLVNTTSASCMGTVTSNTKYFQTRVLDTDCTVWQEHFRKIAAAKNFQNIFVGGVLSQCEDCIADFGSVQTYPPACSRLVKGAAVIRSKIMTEHRDRTEAIYCKLEQWWQLGPLVSIAGNLRLADRECFYPLSSLNDTGECLEQIPIPDLSIFTIGISTGFGAVAVLLGAVITVAIIRR